MSGKYDLILVPAEPVFFACANWTWRPNKWVLVEKSEKEVETIEETEEVNVGEDDLTRSNEKSDIVVEPVDSSASDPIPVVEMSVEKEEAIVPKLEDTLPSAMPVELVTEVVALNVEPEQAETQESIKKEIEEFNASQVPHEDDDKERLEETIVLALDACSSTEAVVGLNTQPVAIYCDGTSDLPAVAHNEAIAELIVVAEQSAEILKQRDNGSEEQQTSLQRVKELDERERSILIRELEVSKMEQSLMKLKSELEEAQEKITAQQFVLNEREEMIKRDQEEFQSRMEQQKKELENREAALAQEQLIFEAREHELQLREQDFETRLEKLNAFEDELEKAGQHLNARQCEVEKQVLAMSDQETRLKDLEMDLTNTKTRLEQTYVDEEARLQALETALVNVTEELESSYSRMAADLKETTKNVELKGRELDEKTRNIKELEQRLEVREKTLELQTQKLQQDQSRISFSTSTCGKKRRNKTLPTRGVRVANKALQATLKDKDETNEQLQRCLLKLAELLSGDKTREAKDEKKFSCLEEKIANLAKTNSKLVQRAEETKADVETLRKLIDGKPKNSSKAGDVKKENEWLAKACHGEMKMLTVVD